MAIELSQDEFDNLKESIKKTMQRLEVLQRLYRSQTGTEYKPFYLTDPRNQKNLAVYPGRPGVDNQGPSEIATTSANTKGGDAKP